MRYDKQHKTAIRQRILDMASLRFRSEGIAAVGIANLMADLGLTHGGFYWHFKDKEDLVAQVCQQAMQQMAEQWQQQGQQAGPGQQCRGVAEHYLSIPHRDFPDTGCVAVALAGELSRRGSQARQAFTSGLEQQLATLAAAAQQDAASGGSPLKPTVQLSLMVGALLLSRAVNDPALSARLLEDAAALIASQTAAAC
ncbi:TetR/AcrR family transcriptional regulator [Aquitalea magnusonii]|uniref:TetR family transcriptional regulator n=2 Tax=Aquitalea magnusonii TaxID=332411 RepID=A0A318JGU9_9NEIS|nr:TetR family transcriptional regulator [Aquitalea magnusonii]PXX46343.1 TetR family transcriptional regulator [Aquitalea magnusonii]